MADYKTMYLSLFHETSQAIETLTECKTKIDWQLKRLQAAQMRAEEMYISTAGDEDVQAGE